MRNRKKHIAAQIYLIKSFGCIYLLILFVTFVNIFAIFVLFFTYEHRQLFYVNLHFKKAVGIKAKAKC